MAATIHVISHRQATWLLREYASVKDSTGVMAFSFMLTVCCFTSGNQSALYAIHHFSALGIRSLRSRRDYMISVRTIHESISAIMT